MRIIAPDPEEAKVKQALPFRRAITYGTCGLLLLSVVSTRRIKLVKQLVYLAARTVQGGWRMLSQALRCLNRAAELHRSRTRRVEHPRLLASSPGILQRLLPGASGVPMLSQIG